MICMMLFDNSLSALHKRCNNKYKELAEMTPAAEMHTGFVCNSGIGGHLKRKSHLRRMPWKGIMEISGKGGVLYANSDSVF